MSQTTEKFLSHILWPIPFKHDRIFFLEHVNSILIFRFGNQISSSRCTRGEAVTGRKCERGNSYHNAHDKAADGDGRAPSCKLGRCPAACSGRQQNSSDSVANVPPFEGVAVLAPLGLFATPRWLYGCRLRGYLVVVDVLLSNVVRY